MSAHTAEKDVPIEPTIAGGEVRDVTVQQVVDDPNAKVYWLDANTKYYEASCMYGKDEERGVTEVSVMLYAGARTLRRDESTDKPTVVTWVVPSLDDWQVMVDPPGRYSTVVAIYRPLPPDGGRA